MKSPQLSSLLLASLLLAFSACEKSAENIKNVSETKAVTTAGLVYPLTGTDTSGGILPMRKLPKAIVTKGFYAFPHLKVQLIDTVCKEYLEGTKKVDFVADGTVGHIIGNSDFSIYVDPDFVRAGVRKLSSGPNGWWMHWNYSPYTESEHPDVLFPLNRRYGEKHAQNYISLALDRGVKTFGFEVAPNETGKDIKVLVTYNNFGTYRGQTMFTVEQTISSPSGARLIAVTSAEPFTYVGIELEGHEYPEKGIAIANLRYDEGN